MVNYKHAPADPRDVIARLRDARGFKSDRALAIAAGIQQPTFARYMSGQSRTMEVANFQALALTLGVTLSELLGEVPIASSVVVRELSKLLATMSNDQREQLLRVAKALSGDWSAPNADEGG